MNYSQFLNDLNVKIQNKSNAIPVSVKTFVNQVLRNEVATNDYKSLIRHTDLNRTIFNDIKRFPLPSDVNEGIIDIILNKNYNNASGIKYRKVSPNIFRILQEQNVVSFDYSNGLKWLLGNFITDNQDIIISEMDTIDSNGLWEIDDDALNIKNEANNYISGNGSISCDVNGTILTIKNTTLAYLDISAINKNFIWIYLPSITNLSNILLKYGSDVSNYYSSTAIKPFNTDEFTLGWNLIEFDKGVATGTPDITNLSFLSISLNFSSAVNITGILFDNIICGTGNSITMPYYSLYPWKDKNTGLWKLNSENNEDELNASSEEYKVWLAICAYEAATAIPLSSEIISLRLKEKDEAIMQYKMLYPSRRIKEQNYIYKPTDCRKR